MTPFLNTWVALYDDETKTKRLEDPWNIDECFRVLPRVDEGLILEDDDFPKDQEFKVFKIVHGQIPDDEGNGGEFVPWLFVTAVSK